MEKHQVETEFQQMYGHTGELICPTDCTDGYIGNIFEHTLKLHYHRGGARDSARLSFKPKHSRHDLLATTTPGKVHRAGSTSVYCLCRLHECIRHRWEDLTMAATEEIWMP